jgi:putative peptidoglycan lipid II flippase
MCALLLLAEPIVATLFQHGRFDAFDTRMSTLSIVALCCGLPAYALVKVLLPAFYARQDTSTPVRAGVAALVMNMLCNGLFIALLFELWAPPAVRQESWLAGIAQVPGLHLALGIASALSSYLNFALLWHWLKRAGVYQRQPGWLRHWSRLALACVAMMAVLLAGRWLWPDWDHVATFTRIWRLGVLVIAGGATYAAVLFAAGLRLRELRAV